MIVFHSVPLQRGMEQTTIELKCDLQKDPEFSKFGSRNHSKFFNNYAWRFWDQVDGAAQVTAPLKSLMRDFQRISSR